MLQHIMNVQISIKMMPLFLLICDIHCISQGSGTRSSHRRASRTTLVRHNLRKMSNEERPLVLALARCLKDFVNWGEFAYKSHSDLIC